MFGRFFFVALLGLVASVVSAAVSPSPHCPISSGKDTQCTCVAIAQGIMVNCKDLNDRSQLSKSLKPLEGYVLVQLSMRGVNLRLSSADFETVKFRKMDVESSNLQVYGRTDAFSFDNSEESLRTVQFKDSVIDLGNTTMSTDSEFGLKSLEFDGCRFNNYTTKWFGNLTVERVKIIRSSQLKEHVANGLIGVEEFEQSDSSLERLSQDILPIDKSKLDKLVFSGNKITTIDKNFLVGADVLQTLDLSYNLLETLDQETFKNFIGEINLAENPLKCDNLAWLGKEIRQRSIRVAQYVYCMRGSEKVNVEWL